MASLNSSNPENNNAPQKQYYNYRLYYNDPFEINLSSRCTVTLGNNGRKYPNLSTFINLGMVDRSGGNFSRKQVTLVSEDWYRWVITIGELLSRVKEIYVDNHIADHITEDDFKIVTFKGEVVQMVPMIAKIEDNMVPAVRIILNEPSVFADFPIIDVKNMYNIINKIDIMSASMLASVLGEML